MNPSRPLLGRFPSVWTTLVLVLAVWAILVAGVVFLHYWQGIPFGEMTRDPADVFEVPLYLGFLSQAGILFWAAAGAICMFSAQVLPRHAVNPGVRRFLFVSGLLTMFLTLDDAFLLHDRLFPEFGIPEKGVYLAYAGLGLLYLVAFRSLIVKTDYILLGAALVLFAASLGFDIFVSSGEVHFLAEDGAKLAGILCWLAYFFRVGVSAVRNHLAARGDTPNT